MSGFELIARETAESGTRAERTLSRSLSDSKFSEGERQRLLTIEDESIKNNL